MSSFVLKRILGGLTLSLGLSLSLPLPIWAQSGIQEINYDPTVGLNPADLSELLTKLKLQITESKRYFPDLASSKIDALVQEAETLIQAPESNPDAPKLWRQAYNHLIYIQGLLMPSRNIEFRAALLDTDMLPRSVDGIKQMISKYKKAGFNVLIPEVFRRGMSIFPNRITETEPGFTQIDVLKIMLQEAHTQGMEVYPWFWVFRVNSPGYENFNPVLSRLPQFMSISAKKNNGSLPESSDSPGDETSMFISPASLEWRELFVTIVKDMLKTYPADGLLLDYIRYGNNITDDTVSMTQFQMEYFRKVGSFASKNIAPGSDLLAEWHLWREEQVARMLQTLNLEIAPLKAPFPLGAAVFRNEVLSRIIKLQNWRHWSNNNWLHFVAPMLYTSNVYDLDLWLDWETDQNSRYDMLYPILGAHQLGNSADLLKVIHLLRERHIPGVSFFAMRHMTDQQLELLGQGPFRTPALVPHKNTSLAIKQHLTSFNDWLLALLKKDPPPAFASNLGAFQQRLAVILNPFQASPEELSDQLNKLDAQFQNMASELPETLYRGIQSRLGDAIHLVRIYKQHYQPSLRYTPPNPPPVKVMPEAKALPKGKVLFFETASPEIDGQLESLWTPVPPLGRLLWSTGSAYPKVNTQVKMGFDKEALYIAYDNQEPTPARQKAVSRLDQSPDIFKEDDTVEVFISPGDNIKNYYYFVVNPLNTKFQKASFDSSWQAPWTSAVQKQPQSWQVEIQIPFSSLSMTSPEKGGTWRGNVCRRRPQEVHAYHCWSFTYGGIHRNDRFGYLEFVPPTPKEKEDEKEQEKNKQPR